MKATTHLGPFSDSSLPLYWYMEWYQANYEYKDSLSIWEDISTDFTVLKSDLDQLYVTIEGKAYLVSAPLSMMSELLGKEVEGELEFTWRKFGMDEQQARELTMAEKEEYKIYRFIARQPEKEDPLKLEKLAIENHIPGNSTTELISEAEYSQWRKPSYGDIAQSVTNKESEKPIFGEWQLCPKCNGTGRMYNPASVTDAIFASCDVCNGAKILARPIIKSSHQ